jgi:hypothetical protein
MIIFLFFGCVFLLIGINFGSSVYIKILNEKYSISGEPFEGYILFSPEYSKYTYLLNNNGKIVYNWKSDYIDGLAVYLLENGNLIHNCLPGINPTFAGGGISGRIEKFDEDSNLLWEFEYFDNNHCLHHDIEPLPNGNILLIAWEYKTREEAIAAGRNPDRLQGNAIWPDHIIEVKPIGTSGFDILWEWHAWDHVIQEFDPTKENYGIVAEHPELIDINFGNKRADWLHINSVDYNEEFDQILLSVHNFNEIWVIDHSTTTEEAAGHTGGRYGKGGDLLYRWGNPQAYRAGDPQDQKLFGQHDATWIEKGYPGEGNILLFNNGGDRPDGRYSSVDEFVPPVNIDGAYAYTPGSAYGPENQLWIYKAENPRDFYSGHISGAQRLPNGNTLICSGAQGFFFEVTLEKDVVWEYQNVLPTPKTNHVFNIQKYPTDYPGIPEVEGINQQWNSFHRLFNLLKLILQR